ncbi:CHASE domain-containing protein [Psychrosphaera sp.]|nr:CHASE domain-containing protein [Psychrosphaera sp.]
MTLPNNKAFVVLIAFLSYYIFAKIGLLFAIPPGFASAIWPAAGIALASYLILGRFSLIGVFIASWFANYQVINSTEHSFSFAILVLPGLLALGTTIQLIISKRLLLKFCEMPIQAMSLKSVIRFLVIVGPLSCLFAASFNTTAIALANDTPLSGALFIALNWWVGDFLGVIFFTPVLLSLFENGYYQQKKDRVRIAIPALMLFFLVSFVFYLSRINYEESRLDEFERRTTGFSQKLNIIENTITQQLVALKGLFNSSAVVSREEFRHFTNNIMNPDIKIRAIAWLPKVEAETRESFEAHISESDLSNFSLKHLVDGKVQKASAQDYYLPILYSEPLGANLGAIGLDVLKHNIVGPSVRKAVNSGTMVVSPQLSLVQNLEKFNAVIVYYPYYKKEHVKGVDNPVQNLLGIFEVVIELDLLMENIYKNSSYKDFSLQTHYLQNQQTTAFFNLDYRDNALFKFESQYTFFDTKLQVLFSSSEQFDIESVDWSSWFIIVVGCLVSTFSVIFIIVMTNLSEMLEHKVAIKTAQLREKNEELLKANEAKNRFLANMSHEYRTPLNAIIGFAQLGKSDNNKLKSLDYFEQILNSSKFLLGIINNVLDFSKISENQVKLEKQSFDLSKSVDTIFNLLVEKAKQKDVSLIVKKYNVDNYTLKSDSVRIEQVMMNLVENAIKFTATGCVTLSVKYEDVGGAKAKLLIKVQDEGIGIPQDKIDSLFESFTQADESTTRRFGGTGLGLAIVKQICDAMGATIDVYSLIGQGTSFEVGIPVDIDELPDAVKEDKLQASNLEKLIAQDNKKYLFDALIVEDNKINQLIASKQLELLKVKSKLADDGQQGLDYLATHKPDIVFVDLHMPVLDGFSMIREMKKTLDLAAIPIVIISASVSHEDKEYAKILGVNHYVTKPFLLEELSSVVDKLLVQKSQL